MCYDIVSVKCCSDALSLDGVEDKFLQAITMFTSLSEPNHKKTLSCKVAITLAIKNKNFQIKGPNTNFSIVIMTLGYLLRSQWRDFNGPHLIFCMDRLTSMTFGHMNHKFATHVHGPRAT